MLQVIEHLLRLQTCDRQRLRAKTELAGIEPRRRALEQQLAQSQEAQHATKHHLMHLESERHRLEVEVVAKKEQIEHYMLQQFQTKKNEEYRALTHEIDACKADIAKLEDQQLDLMEQAELTQRQIAAANQALQRDTREITAGLADLAARTEAMQRQLAQLDAQRLSLASAVEEMALVRYERLLNQKGGNVVVGVERGVCGGCHMKLPAQIVVSCQAHEEVMLCPNCGRILYYTPDMEPAVAD